jgi:hypothetical protein
VCNHSRGRGVCKELLAHPCVCVCLGREERGGRNASNPTHEKITQGCACSIQIRKQDVRVALTSAEIKLESGGPTPSVSVVGREEVGCGAGAGVQGRGTVTIGAAREKTF